MNSLIFNTGLRSLLAALSLLGASFAHPVSAQDHETAAQAMIQDQRWMKSYYDLEYAMRELMWHQSTSVLAAYGDYNSYQRVEGGADGSDLSRFVNRIRWNQTSVGDFKRALARQRGLPEEDKIAAEDVLVLYEVFLAAAREVARLLSDGETEAANIAYRDGSVPVFKEIGASLYSLRLAAQDRFGENAKVFR